MNISWNEGYTTEIPYTYGYYGEMNPTQLQLLLLAKGYAVPKIKIACELGFGQGISINMHAAASNVNWYGTDFSPVQVNFAKETANLSGTSVHLYDDSFAEFAKRDDLPQFDYIALHGIWSWISDENKAVIVDFIKNKLNVGGMLYISYNTLPGHNKTAPVRKLLSLYEEFCGIANVNMTQRVSEALDAAEKILSLSPAHCNDNSHALSLVKKLRTQDHSYLAHEYLNMDWEPMYFEEMAKWLESAKLTFVTSATASENLDAINFDDEHKKLLQSINNPIFRETVKDFIFNQQFRRDVWIKGPISLNAAEKQEALSNLECILISSKGKVPSKLRCMRGEADVASVYNAILDVIGDNQIHSVSEIMKNGSDKNVGSDLLVLGLVGLMSQGKLLITQKADQDVIERSQKLNMALLDKIRTVSKIQFLASPLTGGALSFNYLQQLCLSEYLKSDCRRTPEELTAFLDTVMKEKGLQLIHEGKTVQDEVEKLQKIQEMVTEFFEQINVYGKLNIFPFNAEQ